MKKHEGAVLSAFTGCLLCSFPDFHEYAEKLIGRPVWTHEFGTPEIRDKLKELSEEEFMDIMNNLED